MSTLTLRPAVPADLAAILAIEQAVFGDAWSAESFASEFDEPYAWFRVVEDAGVIGGYVIARIVGGQAEIANIAVAPAAQRHGLGGRLLDAAIAAAVEADCDAVWLEVRPSNAAARRLYETRGFVLIGRRRGYYRAPVEDALVMRRAIDADEGHASQ